MTSAQRAAGVTRRTMLAAAGASGLGVALAACGGSGGGSSDAAADSKSGKVLGKTGDIPEGGGKIFADQSVVVTQPKAGEFKAFSSICTHQGCPVTKVANGTIQCPCHGSQYSVADGSVTHPPAPRPLAPVKIKVTGDSIALA
jgi:Rieske Fe-S protein